MITVLVDHNIEGQAAILQTALVSEGWIELAVLRIVSFKELYLPFETSDLEVWEFAQAHAMVLLTANRNKDGKASLERVILELNQPSSYPVITIANVDRIVESDYRNRCATKLAEICLEIERYLGAGRVYIP